MTIKLHVFPPSPRAFKVILAAHHLGIPYELNVVNLPAGEQRTPAFTSLNVNQRMPVLEDDGYVLWESNAILEYLAAKKGDLQFLPQEFKSRLQVSKWLYWESAHWDACCAIFMYERVVKALFNLGTPAESEIERGTALFNRLAAVLDTELSKHRYICGEAVSAPDIAIAAPFSYAERAQFPLGPYRAVSRWIDEMKSLPAWKNAMAVHQP